MEAINLAGIPIVAYPGHQGGYGILKNYKIDKQFLSIQDLVAICSVLQGVNTAITDRKLDVAVDKLASLVPRDQVKKFKADTEQMVIDILPWGVSEKQKRRLALLQTAISQTRLLHFTYHNSQGESKSRMIEPMTLIFKGYLWYLFGYCRRRRDFRLFRVTRMNHIKLLRTTFSRRQQSYKKYLKDESIQLPWIKLRLKFSPRIRYRVEDYFSEYPVKFLPNGACVASVRLPENEWLYNFLLSYGEDVEVLRPAKVRAMLQTKAKKIYGLYKPDIGLSQSFAMVKSNGCGKK